jgi:hypothetical protein
MKFIIALVCLSFVSACSVVKSREEVKEEQKAAAAAEEPEPMDTQAIDDSLAEMGVDPDAKAADSKKVPEPDAHPAGVKKKKSKSR